MKRPIILVVGILLLVVLIWGLIGSSISTELGTTCDFGIGKDGNILCWKWHQNMLGDIGEEINNLFNK